MANPGGLFPGTQVPLGLGIRTWISVLALVLPGCLTLTRLLSCPHFLRVPIPVLLPPLHEMVCSLLHSRFTPAVILFPFPPALTQIHNWNSSFCHKEQTILYKLLSVFFSFHFLLLTLLLTPWTNIPENVGKMSWFGKKRSLLQNAFSV